MNKEGTTELKPYMVFSRVAGPQEAAYLIFAHNRQEAKRIGWDGDISDTFIDCGVNFLKDGAHLYAEGDIEKLTANEPHGNRSPSACNGCNLWGEEFNKEGYCQACWEETSDEEWVPFWNQEVIYAPPPLPHPFLRFIKYVNFTDYCWEWTGHLSPNDYGSFWDGENQVRAHRWSYEYFVGPIPQGLEIDHLCRNRKCVNPDHLEAVTHGENVRRGSASIVARHQQLSKTHCRYGHPYDESNTYHRPDGGRGCKLCRARRWREWKERQDDYKSRSD